MTLTQFNNLSLDDAVLMLHKCCGSNSWAQQVAAGRPYTDLPKLARAMADKWYSNCGETDWREAFSHHPRIGDVSGLKEKFAATAHFSASEQAGISDTPDEILQQLHDANRKYEAKNGFIFIVCATGKTAPEMLALLNDRLNNTPKEELRLAMGEQAKITLIRLKNSIEGEWNTLPASHITTHVLDTATGLPAKGITIRLQDRDSGYETFAQGITNADGRIPDLLPQSRMLTPGRYKMIFDTGGYYTAQGIRTFYPVVPVFFETFDESHYHIPLLLSPYGYTTYRGS